MREMKEESIIAPKEIRENAAIQVQLADLFVHCLENGCIRHDVIKEAPDQVVSGHNFGQRQ